MTKDEAAHLVADAQFHLDSATLRVFRVLGADEDESASPIKLLVVNDMTPALGIMPVGLPGDPEKEVSFPITVIEITSAEFEKVMRGDIHLPHGWKIGDELFAVEAAVGAHR